MKIIKTIATTISLLAVSIPALAAFDYNVAEDFNVYTFGNFYARNGHTQGRIAAGATLSVQGYDFVNPDGHPYADTLNHNSLSPSVIAGGVGAFTDSTVHYGDAIFGAKGQSTNSTFNRNLTVTGDHSLTNTTVTGTYTAPNSALSNATGSSWGNYAEGSAVVGENFTTAKTYFTDYSNSLSQYGTTGTFSQSDNVLTLVGDNTSATQVFNLTANDLANVYDITIEGLGSATSVLINFEGTSLNLSSLTANPTNGQMNENSIFAGLGLDVIYNFSDANSLTLTNTNFYGTVLAPNAAVNAVNGSINGRMISNSFMSTDNFYFNVDDSVAPAVPEPSTYLMMAIGLGMMGTLIRKRINTL